jgi:hypothetical protein
VAKVGTSKQDRTISLKARVRSCIHNKHVLQYSKLFFLFSRLEEITVMMCSINNSWPDKVSFKNKPD